MCSPGSTRPGRPLAGFIAIDEAEEVIRAMDAGFGAGVGSDAAVALRAGMLAAKSRAVALTAAADARDAQLPDDCRR